MAGSDTSKEEDILEDALEAFKLARDHEADNRKLALDDLRFARLGEQWPPQMERQRLRDGRPVLTINVLPMHIRSIVNDARQNKPGINVHPVDSKADPETADIFNGLIRQIEQSSDAEVAYDTALDSAVTGGFGYFKINTRYARDDSFDQDLVIERVANPFAIFGDPASTEADSSDWMTAFELEKLSRKAFERRFKGAEVSSFEDPNPGQRPPDEIDQVTIASHWDRQDAEKQIVALSMPDPMADPIQVIMAMRLGVSDQLIVDLAVYEENKELFDGLGMTVQGDARKVPSWTVTQRLLSGSEVLDTIDWAGKYIPIIPVYGEEVNVEGVRHFRGMVRDAKDSQRSFNFWRTNSTEVVALAPKAPWLAKKGTLVDIGKWETANVDNWAYLEYNGEQAPSRQPHPGVAAGAIQEATNAAEDIKAILGVLGPQLGQDNESSGRAILARQRQIDVSSFHFIDNLSRAIRHGGRVLLDLIPKTYSTSRIIRIIGQDGQQLVRRIAPAEMEPPPIPPQVQSQIASQTQPGAAPVAPGMPPALGTPPGGPMAPQAAPMAPSPAISPQMQKELDAISRVYDITVGKYDLTVAAGPSYQTQREELNTVLVELIRAAPAAAPVLIDLIVKTLDMPDADEVADRLQALLPPQAQGGPSPQMQQMQQQFQAAIDQAHAQLQQMGQKLQAAEQAAQEAQQDQQQKGVEMNLRARELDIKQFEAETDRLQAQTDSQRAAKEPAAPVSPFGVAA